MNGRQERSNSYKISILGHAHRFMENTRDIRILYVIDGGCELDIGNGKIMKKADIFLFNSGESCRIHVDRDSLAAVISIDYFMLCDSLEKARIRFYMDSLEDTGQKYTEIKDQMQSLLLAYAGDGVENGYREQGYFYFFLSTLVSEFLLPGEDDFGSDEDRRIARIFNYIHANYRTEANLNEIAEELYLSVSTVSRLFKKYTGEHFVSYVKKLRLQNVVQALLETEDPITKIAVENGFSTPSALNKIFRTEYGITPSEYRKKNRTDRVQMADKGNKELLFSILKEDKRLKIAQADGQNVIRAKCTDLELWGQCKNRILNVGPAYILRYANMQRDVLFLAEKLHVKYLRIWNLFSSRLMICKGKGKYNFSFLDEIMDLCVEYGLKLCIDLAQRKSVAMASMTEEIYNIDDWTEFESEAEWMDAVGSMLAHIKMRYHEEVIGKWVFEFSFFLNDRPYYLSENYSSRKVWERGCELVKQYLPMAKVAGPGMPASMDRELVEMIIKDFFSSGHAPDIFTTINFPYSFSEGENRMGYRKPVRRIVSRNFLGEQLALVHEILEKFDFCGQYWVTDWGISIGNRNYIQDSCFRGTSILENVLHNHDKVGTLGIFYASDTLNVFSDSSTVLSGSAGILTRNGICKPAYYAYRFLCQLGKYRICQTDNCIITAKDESDISILCYNDKMLGPKYYFSEENTYRPEELHKLFLNLDPQHMEIILKFRDDENMFTVRHQVLNENKGSVLNKWIGFGCEENLIRDEIEYLKKTSLPEITSERMKTFDGLLHISFCMEPNEMRFITIVKEQHTKISFNERYAKMDNTFF